MIDYLMTFESEAQAHAVLYLLGLSFPEEPDGEGGITPARFDTSRVLPVRLGIGYEDAGRNEETGETIRRPVWHPAFWIAVSLPVPHEALYALQATMREADRDKALAGEPYVLRERFTEEQLATPWFFDRQWAGVDYSNNPAAPPEPEPPLDPGPDPVPDPGAAS